MGKSVRMRGPMVIFTLLALIARSQTSHNDAEADDFVHQDDIYNSQLMLDNLALSTEEQESMTSSLLFKPSVIDFLQRSIGDPHDQVIILFNKHKNRSVYLGSITGNSPDFHCKYFKDVLIPPEGNTTFNLVFMPRKLGITHGSLVIHTSFGILKYHMRGEGTECLYRLKPLVGLKAPLNATITPEIVLYNPHAARLQITEIASSSGEFQLELPTGATEGPKELWEIPPFSTKTLIRVRFTGKIAGNHTAYVRIKMGIGSDPTTLIEKILIVPIEIEIMKETGIYSKIPFLDFGIVGSNDNVTKLNLNLLNSGEKFIRLKNWGVEGDLEAIMCIKVNVQRFTRNENIADRLFIEIDWSKITEDKKFLTGNIYITTSMERDDSDNGFESNEIIYRIPFAGQILKGSIEYDESILRFLISSDKSSIENSRDVIIRNKFNVPLSITNITVPENCSTNFLIDGFKTNVIQPNKESTLFQITRSLTKNLNKTISTYIKLITNITEYELPIFSYTGRLQRIVPLDGSIKYQLKPDMDEEQLDFGILPISTTGESLIGFVNNNPISIPINNWKGTIEPGSKGTATITVIMKGCGTLSMEKELVFCHTIKPGEWVVFYVSVHSSSIDTFYGKFTIETDYEEIITPIRFRTAMGRLELNKELLHFQNCFPGRLCTLNLTAYSTFLSAMKVEGISADSVEGITYDFSNEKSIDDDMPEIPPNVISSIGQLVFDPKAECKNNNCYSSFDLLSKPFGVKWMATLDNYEQYHKLDSERLLQQLRLFNDTRELLRTITFRLTTTQIKRFDFNASVEFIWPKLLTENILFPTIQIEQEAVKVFTINNPSDQLLFVHLTLHDVNVHGTEVIDKIPTEILSKCTNCTLSEENVFSLFLFEEDDIYVNYVKPNSFLKVAVKFSAKVPGTYSTIFYMRNNLTLIDAVWIQAKAVVPAFKFGNRKPGSPTALQFEITDKHLKLCSKFEMDTYSLNYMPIQTKRTFTAKNYGEVPILISAIRVEDESCIGYGFRIVDCGPFELQPNASKKIEIAFSPDFTLGRVVRTLYFDSNINFPVNFTLLGTVPSHGLETCSLNLKRPSFETALRISLFCVLVVALIGTIFTAYLDSNKVINEHIQSLSREKGPLQPPLDLRQIALQNPLTADDANEKDSSSPSTNQSTSKATHSNSNRKKIKQTFTKIVNGNSETSLMHQGQNQFKKSWSEFTSKMTRMKTADNTNKSQQAAPQETKNNQARNKRSITPPKEEAVVVNHNNNNNIKEKSQPIIEEDSSSTTTESSAVSLPCSAMSDTQSTASSASSCSEGANKEQNYCNKINNSANDAIDSNSIQQQNKPNKVKVNKTKSLPANYETSITSNNSISAKDTGNLNKNNKENNVKAKVVKEKQIINSVGITSINGTNQNGHNKNDKKFSKTPGRERKPVNPNNKKNIQSKPPYKAATALQFPAVSVPQKINTQPIQPIANNNNNNSVWTENRARFSDVVAQTPMEKSKMLQSFEQKYNYDKLNDQFKCNLFKSKDDNYANNDVKEVSCSPGMRFQETNAHDLGPIGGPKKSPTASPNSNTWEPYGAFLNRPVPSINSDSYFTTSFNDIKPPCTSEQQFNNSMQQQNTMNQTNLNNLWEYNPYVMNNPYELWSTFQRQQVQPPMYSNPWPMNNSRPANVPIRAPPGFNVVRDRVNLPPPTENNTQNSAMPAYDSGFNLVRDRGNLSSASSSDQNAGQTNASMPAYDPFRSMDRFSIWGPESTNANNNNDIWSIDPSSKKQD